MKLKCSQIVPGVYPTPDKNRLFSTARTAQQLDHIPSGTIVGVMFQRYERDAVTNKDVPVYFIEGLHCQVLGTALTDFVL